MNHHKLQSHQGRSLVRDSNTYPSLLEAILEAVQNGCDSSAKHLRVVIDQRHRTIDIFDDGVGATPEKFSLALQSIGLSIKSEDSLGQFGLGLIAPLTKCEYFTFTSCPRGVIDQYITWTFRQKDIEGQASDVQVPYVSEERLRFGKVDKSLKLDGQTYQQVTWRTRVHIHNYSKDPVISRLESAEELVREVFRRFGKRMHKYQIKLSVTFADQRGRRQELKNLQPPAYEGEPLSTHLEKGEGGESVWFKLYLAKRDQRGRGQGEVMVGVQGNDYLFPFQLFANAHNRYLDDEALKALKSGLFEGEIVGSGVLLHETRKRFVDNQAMVEFAKAINRWFVSVGVHYVEAAEVAQKDERYQRLGLQAMEQLANIFADDPEMQQMFDLQRSERESRSPEIEGDESALTPQREETDDSARRLPSVPITPRPSPSSPNGPSSPPSKPRSRLPKVVDPYSVGGPLGDRRGRVSSKRFGLEFQYAARPGMNDLWELDEDRWILHFNTMHKLWAKCEGSDRRLRQLMELIGLEVVEWAIKPREQQRLLRPFIDANVRRKIRLLTESSAFNMKSLEK